MSAAKVKGKLVEARTRLWSQLQVEEDGSCAWDVFEWLQVADATRESLHRFITVPRFKP